MQHVNLSAVDLNLLVVVEALLNTRSTTEAARQLSLSQPATSHALSRLRELFRDPLLVRSGRALVPTPFAEALHARVRVALDAVRATLVEDSRFDPNSSQRTFAIGTDDYTSSVIAPALCAHVQERAPGIDIFFKSLAVSAAEALERGEIELELSPHYTVGNSRSVRAEQLFQERFVCLVRSDHPLKRSRLTLDRFCELGHVLIAPRGETRRGVVDGALNKLGRKRRVSVTVPHFLVAPLVVARTDLVLTIAERVARRAAPQLGLRIVKAPLELPGFDVSMHWHVRHEGDAAHGFLRDCVRAAVRTL
jgi:DNA-binding transcriptional LysR family regulator